MSQDKEPRKFTIYDVDLMVEEIEKLRAENERLKLERDFILEYLNPADTSFRKMIDTFKDLTPDQKDKLIGVVEALAKCGGGE